MASNSNTPENISIKGGGQNFALALTIMVTLFFVFGIITVLNDILIPHFKSTFSLNYTKAMLINFFFFGAYFVMGLPSSWLINRIGYQKAIVTGLCIVSAGCLSFYPASLAMSYNLFLVALFFIASGITLLQVAANAYVTVLGDPKKASARISLCGGLNSTATVIGPLIGASLILNPGLFNETEQKLQEETHLKVKTERLEADFRNSATAEEITQLDQLLSNDETSSLKSEALFLVKNANDSDIKTETIQALDQVATGTNEVKAAAVHVPYFGLALFVGLIAFVVSRLKLPQIIEPSAGKKEGSALDYRQLKLGIVAIFLYVGAEVVVGSLLINYMGLSNILGIEENEAALYVTLYWGCAGIARFIGFAVLQKVKPQKALLVVSAVAAIFITNSILTDGFWSLSTMIAVGFCHSVMWPIIFSLALDGLGEHKTQGSGLLIMGVVGGAFVPMLQGGMADSSIGLQNSYVVTVLCYLFLVYYAVAGYKPKRMKKSKIKVPAKAFESTTSATESIPA